MLTPRERDILKAVDDLLVRAHKETSLTEARYHIVEAGNLLTDVLEGKAR